MKTTNHHYHRRRSERVRPLKQESKDAFANVASAAAAAAAPVRAASAFDPFKISSSS